MRRFLLLAALVLAAGCGSSADESPGGATSGSDAEAAWLDLLTSMGLEPAQDYVEVIVSGGDGKIGVILTLSAEAPDEVYFADGLYGATAYTFAGAAWQRVDTAELRTQIAPLLHRGDKAQFSLPVESADFYRVLVPVDAKASWSDSA